MPRKLLWVSFWHRPDFVQGEFQQGQGPLTNHGLVWWIPALVDPTEVGERHLEFFRG